MKRRLRGGSLTRGTEEVEDRPVGLPRPLELGHVPAVELHVPRVRQDRTVSGLGWRGAKPLVLASRRRDRLGKLLPADWRYA